jgi:hypothetical protein
VRRAFETLRLTLNLICGWVWFGSSGVALVCLWIAANRREGAGDGAVVSDSGTVLFSHVTPFRVVFTTRSGRFEVYRDEVSALEWARLRRRCLTDQPATGRNTSS